MPFRGWAAEWESCCEERAVIAGELEFVVFLDPRELGIGQPGPDVAPAGPGQPAGGFLAQALSIAAVHGRTVAAAPEPDVAPAATGL